MKILVIAHSFPQNDNDFRGRFILDYIKSDNKNQYHVVAPHYDGNFVTTIDGTTVHYFKWQHGFLAGRRLYNPITVFVTLKMIFLFIFRSRKIIKNKNIDSVLACWALPGGFVGLILKKLFKINYNVWLLGTDVNKFINIPFFLPAVLKGAERVFSNSSNLLEKISKKVPSVKVDILPTRSSLPEPTVPRNPVHIDKNNTNVFFVGRLEEVKGIDIFIEIAENVKKVRQNVAFFVIGDGSMTKIVKNAEKNGIIKHLGRLSLGEISYYSDFADILCITSRTESMPVVFWEFKDRTRILSFPVGDIPKYLEQQNICNKVDEFVQKIVC